MRSLVLSCPVLCKNVFNFPITENEENGLKHIPDDYVQVYVRKRELRSQLTVFMYSDIGK
jgi:hypothetical protein